MEFDDVNKFFNYCMAQLITMVHKSEQYIIYEYSTYVILSISLCALWFFCNLIRHYWIKNVLNLFFKRITNFWKRNRCLFCYYCQAKDDFFKNKVPNNLQNSTTYMNKLQEETRNQVSPITCSKSNTYEVSNISKLQKATGKVSPIINYKNVINNPSSNIDIPKFFYKKLVRDDVRLRYQLLAAEKNLCATVRQVKKLEKTLSNVTENTVRDHHRSSWHRTPHKLNSVLNGTLNYSTRDSKVWDKNINANSTSNDEITEKISRLKGVYASEIASLKEKISQKEETIRKLLESKDEIAELCQKVQHENDKLQRKMTITSMELQMMTILKDRFEQASTNIYDLVYNISEELKKIHDSKNAPSTRYKSPRHDMTVITEENESEEPCDNRPRPRPRRALRSSSSSSSNSSLSEVRSLDNGSDEPLCESDMSVFKQDLERIKELNFELLRRSRSRPILGSSGDNGSSSEESSSRRAVIGEMHPRVQATEAAAVAQGNDLSRNG